MNYLVELTLRVVAGAERLPEAVRDRHADYLKTQQRDDGGFAGRAGQSDPYYTGFALRALAMLGVLDEPIATRAGQFLGQQIDRPLGSIDFLSLTMGAALVEMAAGIDVFQKTGCRREEALTQFVKPLRRPDGGYAKSERGGPSSTYHTFLVTACKELAGAPPEDPDAIAQMIGSRQRIDGGFVEIDPARHSGTNPTAAAIGLLRMVDRLDDSTRTAAGEFLAAMQTEEGGLRANSRIPVADLLSTFTGLVALCDLGAADRINTAAVKRYVLSLERPDGGFHAGAFDDTVDVEYTFYGLGALALLENSLRT